MAKAISTQLSDFLIFIVRFFVFVLLGNPLSMFILNLLAPQKAAKFVKEQAFFGEKISAFYERLALKWPMFWARWWIKLENLSCCPAGLQAEYFLKVAVKNKTGSEALKAMRKENPWPASFDVLFFKYGNVKLPYIEDRSYKKSTYSYECVVHVTVAEFMMRNVRLSTSALRYLIEQARTNEVVRCELKKYLASGKLNDSQFELLIDAVTTNPGSGDLLMLAVLLDYVRRYGISDNHMVKIRFQYPEPFVQLLRYERIAANKKRGITGDEKKPTE